MKAKYSKPFQKLISKCKTAKWIIRNDGGAIRWAEDRSTCPMSFAVGKKGICGNHAAKELGFRMPTENFRTIADAADSNNKQATPLEKQVRKVLIHELVEGR